MSKDKIKAEEAEQVENKEVKPEARKNGKADLYYTQVKYLRRVKGGKTGLVLPTQEKNLNATEDEERVRRILGSENEIS